MQAKDIAFLSKAAQAPFCYCVEHCLLCLPSASMGQPQSQDQRQNDELLQQRYACLQELTARLRSQLQAVEADVAELCQAAWAAGPAPGSLMAQALKRQQEDIPAGLDLSAAPLPPTEHVVDEGAAPEGTGYEILLQVLQSPCTLRVGVTG